MLSDPDLVIIGAGAAGIGAARALDGAPVTVQVLEARARIGGRAHTHDAFPFDLGCGWLHSADRNVLTEVADQGGFHVARTPSAWRRPALRQGLTTEEQAALWEAFNAFEDRLEAQANAPVDAPASAFLDPACRFNPLLEAILSYISGEDAERVSAIDYARYEDSGLNWRIAEGYGRVIAEHGKDIPVALETIVTAIDHTGPRVRVETNRGTLTARAAIVTLPTALIAEGAVRFTPDLPAHRAAAAAAPLGAALKVCLKLATPEAVPENGHLFGRTDTRATGSYYLRPLGRPWIEVYLAGDHARALEAAGEQAVYGFCIDELAGLLGEDVRTALTPLAASAWQSDPFARGAYSCAAVGGADQRAVLAQPVAGRLFFAGEACHPRVYSTAHGAYETGRAAAAAALAALEAAPLPQR